MRIRYIIVLFIIVILQLFMWYYVTVFCAVYNFSQIGWIQSSIVSTILGLTALEIGIPFIMCLTKFLAIRWQSK